MKWESRQAYLLKWAVEETAEVYRRSVPLGWCIYYFLHLEPAFSLDEHHHFLFHSDTAFLATYL
jgi:hypothetical protein